MKRVCYEWGAILCGSVAVCCLSWWLVSVISDRASGGLDLDGRNFVRIENGCAVLANCGAYHPSPWNDLEDFFAYPVDSPPESVYQEFAVPGLRYLRISWFGGDYDYYYAAEISLLIPGTAAAVLGALLGLLYWRFQRATRLTARPQAT